MGDTPRSQTISTQTQGIASQVARESGRDSDKRLTNAPPILVGGVFAGSNRGAGQGGPGHGVHLAGSQDRPVPAGQVVSRVAQKYIYRCGQGDGQGICGQP